MRLYSILLAMGLLGVVACTPQAQIMYQCADGSVQNDSSLCAAPVACPSCPAPQEKLVYRDVEVEKLVFVCQDGSVQADAQTCIDHADAAIACKADSLKITPAIMTNTVWYGNEGYIKTLQFGVENVGCTRFESASTDLVIYKDGAVVRSYEGWDKDELLLDKSDYSTILGSMRVEGGLRVTESGRYQAVLTFRNSNGAAVYQGTSFFYVPTE